LAQSKDVNWDILLIREDNVKPSMTEVYEEALMDLKMVLTADPVDGLNYYIHLQDNYHFSHIIPTENIGSLEEGMLETICLDGGDETLELIWYDLTESIEYSRYYTLKYRPEFSYFPDGDDWLAGYPYRRWNFIYFHPGSEEEVEGLLEAWQHLYREAGIEGGYRVFSGLLGHEQPLFIFTTWAKDPGHYQDRLGETMENLGEDGSILWMKMMDHARQVETVEGWFLPQYSVLAE
jgi:hypothetical protein